MGTLKSLRLIWPGLALLLFATGASAQIDERAVGGPACWFVVNEQAAIVSRHTRQTKAQISAVNAAQAPGAGAHGYGNNCFYTIEGDAIPSWPAPQPGQVLLTAKAVLERGQVTGQTWDSANLQWSPNGTEWFPVIKLTFNPAQILDVMAVDTIQLRLVVPEASTTVEGTVQ